MWLNISLANRNQNALKVRDIIAAKMTTEQIAEAQKLAKEWQEKNYKNCD